jgi:hypothetical protein
MSFNDENVHKLSTKDMISQELKSRFGKYTNNLVIRDAVQKIPGIGIPLDIVLAYLGNIVREQAAVR